MNEKEFDRVERREISKKEFTNTLKALMRTKPVQAPEREPTRKELNEQYRLDRVED